MKVRIYVVLICAVIIVLAVWNNLKYSRIKQKAEIIKEQQDSINLIRYEYLIHNIQINTQIIDSLLGNRKFVDSVHLKNQEYLLHYLQFLINIDRQLLEQNKTQECLNSSTIHTVE